MSLTQLQKLFAERELFHTSISVKLAEEQLPHLRSRMLDAEIKVKGANNWFSKLLVYFPIVGYHVQYNKLKGLVDMNEKYLPEWRNKIAHLKAVLRDEIEP